MLKEIYNRLTREEQGVSPEQEITVYEMTLQELAEEILNSERLIEVCFSRLEAAQQQRLKAQLAFIERCVSMGLPISMEPSDKPYKPYVFVESEQ